MLNKITIGSYYKTESNLHDMNTLIKIICVFLIIIMSFIARDLFVISIILLITLLLMLSSKVPLANYLKPIWSLKWFLIFIIAINIAFYSGLMIITFTIIRLLIVIIISNVLLYTTTISDMTKGLEKFFTPLKIIKVPVNSLALTISLAIRFIPNIFAQARKIMKSLKTKGLDFRTSNFKTKISLINVIIIPLFQNSLNAADTLAESMELRNYQVDGKRSTYKEDIYTLYDILMLTFYTSLLITMILKGGKM